MLDEGTEDYAIPDFTLSLVRSSQTVSALKPTMAPDFDFTPGDLLVERSENGYYHLGDLDLRLRSGTTGPWKSYSTALARRPIVPLPTSPGVLAAADLSPTLPADIPLEIRRAWLVEARKLVLRFTLKNVSAMPVEIGALGLPMVFNNVLNHRSLDEAHAVCSFYDPYIGRDAGYLQVTRLNGHGPALLVIPDGKTPFEAYSPILGLRPSPPGAPPPLPQIFTDLTPRGVTFEGFFEWMVHTQAFAENEWKKAQPWNPPTMVTLRPGEARQYGLRFVVAPAIGEIENTLVAEGRPVAVGIPGYVLPMDLESRLFLKYSVGIHSLEVEPRGAMVWRADRETSHGWKAYTLVGKTWGRTRLVVTFDDGTVQTIHYFVMKPMAQAVTDLGRFLTTKQWFDEPHDPFQRSPSAMTYDREKNEIVTQDSRVWIAGLSDEAGAGSWLALVMKELLEPNPLELKRVEQFIDGALWGRLQYRGGPTPYGVRKSLFYYQPEELPPNYYRQDLNWKSWTSWDKKSSERVDRSFNYPHVAAAYWSLYRLARLHTELVSNHSWDWYLRQAYETSVAMTKYAPGHARFGQMEGDVFLLILEDLRREGMTERAASLEAVMHERAERWRQERYPFGSEMPWDSTGQEEVSAWTEFFGYKEKADVTLNAILGYMPTVPHWGYNGSARRFWDFLYAGKYSRLERQLHHYGSGINAIPVLRAYREHPDNFYLLRVGYGGTMGALTNIDQEGFGSAAFHAFPDTLAFDPLSGDYGSNFLGHALSTATYLVQHPEFGWLAFGGNVKTENGLVKVKPLDSARSRMYIAPAALWLTLDAGEFSDAEYNPQTRTVRVGLTAATEFTPQAFLRVEQPGQARTSYHPTQVLSMDRGAYVIKLSRAPMWIQMEP